MSENKINEMGPANWLSLIAVLCDQNNLEFHLGCYRRGKRWGAKVFRAGKNKAAFEQYGDTANEVLESLGKAMAKRLLPSKVVFD